MNRPYDCLTRPLLMLVLLAGCNAAQEPSPSQPEDLSHPSHSSGALTDAAAQPAGQRIGNTEFAGTWDPGPAPADPEHAMGMQDVEKTAYPQYYYVYGDGTIALPSRNTHLCTLTDFEGPTLSGGLIRVRAFDDATQQLAQISQNNYSIAGAACVPKSNFFNYSSSPISQIFTTKYSWTTPPQTSNGYEEEWGNAAALMTGFGGPFRTTNEDVHVNQALINGKNAARMYSSGPDYIYIYTTAFWFNESSGAQKSIKFIGPNGTGTANIAGDYYIRTLGAGNSIITMASADKSFCYFSRITGQLNASDDRLHVYIDATSHNYKLQVHNQNGHELDAYVRCMAFDQR